MKNQIFTKMMLSKGSISQKQSTQIKTKSLLFLLLFSLSVTKIIGQVGTLSGTGMAVCNQFNFNICPNQVITPLVYGSQNYACTNGTMPDVSFNILGSSWIVAKHNWNFSANVNGQINGFDAGGSPQLISFNASDIITPFSYSGTSPIVVQFAKNGVPTGVPLNQTNFSISINPVIFTGATYVYCPNTSTSIAIGVSVPTQGGPWTYNWQPSNSSTMPAIVSPTANTIYTLTANTTTGNCSSTATVAVTISCTPTGCCIGNNCADIIKNPLSSDWQVPIGNFNYVFNRGVNKTGKVGIGAIGSCTPGNLLEVNKGIPNNISGLRLTDLATATPLAANNKVLSINGSGDVILVSSNPSGISNSCATLNFVPKTITAGGNLGCSQIFDNGTSIGIGTTTGFAYTWTGGLTGGILPATSGVVKLNVNGVSKALAYFATSDQKFKKEINTIKNATDILSKIEGKNYLWKTEEFKEKEFSTTKQYGFIAQELEKIIPEVVATDENGDKSVSYDMIIPILVQGVKEQQAKIENQQKQIDELKVLVNSIVGIDNSKKNIQSIELGDKNVIVLNQNVPNPFAETTTITYNLTDNFTKAQLQFLTSEGKLIKTVDIITKGQGICNVFANDLSSGLYSYSLVVDGKVIDTKKMIKE